MNEGEHETSSRAQGPHSAKRHLSQRALRWVRHAPWSVRPGSVNKGPQRGVHASECGTWFHGNTTESSTSLLLLDTESQPAGSTCDSVRRREMRTKW